MMHVINKQIEGLSLEKPSVKEISAVNVKKQTVSLDVKLFLVAENGIRHNTKPILNTQHTSAEVWDHFSVRQMFVV